MRQPLPLHEDARCSCHACGKGIAVVRLHFRARHSSGKILQKSFDIETQCHRVLDEGCVVQLRLMAQQPGVHAPEPILKSRCNSALSGPAARLALRIMAINVGNIVRDLAERAANGGVVPGGEHAGIVAVEHQLHARGPRPEHVLIAGETAEDPAHELPRVVDQGLTVDSLDGPRTDRGLGR